MAEITGNDFNNTLDTFSYELSDDKIYGLGGDDYLSSYLGNDLLDGGAGSDK